jgi:phospholipase DDHD1
MLEIEKELFQNQMNIRPLDFVTENLFILGSPLAVFLTLRGVRPGGTGLQDHILPKRLCKNLFNLFHPSDAIAYRLEPLILKHYSTISPIEVHRASDSSSAKHIPYKEMKSKALKTSNVEMASNIKESTGSTISCIIFLILTKIVCFLLNSICS